MSLLVAAPSTTTFKGMRNAKYGLSMQLNAPSSKLKNADVLFVSSAREVKIMTDLKPFMTGAKKLSFSGRIKKRNNKVRLKTKGQLLGRQLTLTYEHEIKNRNPLTIKASWSLKKNTRVVANFDFNMREGWKSISLTGISPWLPIHIAGGSMKTFKWSFNHVSPTPQTFTTMLSVNNPANVDSKIFWKLQMSDINNIDLRMLLKTPYDNLKLLSVKIDHRHGNPSFIWNDLTENITFNYQNSVKEYQGKWRMAFKCAKTKKFNKNEVHFLFDTSLKLPFTSRREMKLYIELTGNKNKAELRSVLKSRFTRTYGLNWMHNVPAWRSYLQQVFSFRFTTFRAVSYKKTRLSAGNN